MLGDDLSRMQGREFTELLIAEHREIARINDEQADGCELDVLRRGFKSTAEFHRSVAAMFEMRLNHI
jgi:hypothetical protein